VWHNNKRTTKAYSNGFRTGWALEWTNKLIIFTIIMSDNKHIYSEQLKLGAYYSYDKNNNKVYDIKTMRQDFKELVKRLK
jgi:hypothetical protein